MVKLSVIYEGTPADPEAFDRHYRERHLPLVARLPKVRRITVNRARQLNEGVYMITDVFFDSPADLEAALASPARKETAADRLRFPPFHGTIRYQVLDVSDFPLNTPGSRE